MCVADSGLDIQWVGRDVKCQDIHVLPCTKPYVIITDLYLKSHVTDVRGCLFHTQTRHLTFKVTIISVLFMFNLIWY